MASWLAIVSTSLLVLVSFQTVNSDEPPPTTTLSPSSGGAGFSVGSGRQFVVRQVSTNSGFNRPYGRNTQQQQFMSFQRPYMRTMHYRAPLLRHVNVVRIPYYYTRVYTYIPPPLRYFFTNFDAGNKQFDFTTNDGSASVGDGGAVISFGGAGNEEMKFGGSGSMISMAEQQQQQQQMQQQQQQQQMQQQQQQQQMQQQQQQQQMQQLMQQQQMQQQQQQEQAAFAARQQAMTEAMTSHWAMKGAHAGGGGFLGGRGMTASFNSNGDQVFEQFSSHSGMMGGPRFGPAPQVNSPVLPNVGPGNMGPQVNPSFAK